MLEICLVIISVGLATLLFELRDNNLVVLNLFYLPVALSALFLRRYRAGVLTLFCVITALTVSVIKLGASPPHGSPLVDMLALTFWAAVMGLNAILIGTLSDERLSVLRDLDEAHVGVIEVLSQYFTSADARLKVRAQRIADLSQRVAIEMHLSPQEVSDIRVAALLQCMGNLEVTTKVICRAVNDLNRDPQGGQDVRTFSGSDFVQSLGSVLSGALELMGQRRDPLRLPWEADPHASTVKMPLATCILYTVREYARLVDDGRSETNRFNVIDALQQLRQDIDARHQPLVLAAIKRIELHNATSGSSLARNKRRGDTSSQGAILQHKPTASPSAAT